MKLRPHPRAFTLIEVLVATALGLVALLLAVQLFLPALRAWSDGQKRAEVSQSLLVTTNWLGDDILRSRPGSLHVTDDGTFSLICSRGQSSDHQTTFDRQVAYWLADGQLYRGHRVLNTTGADLAPLSLAEATSLPEKRKVGSDVELFSVVVTVPWRARLHLKLDREGRQGETRTEFASIYAPLDLEFDDL